MIENREKNAYPSVLVLSSRNWLKSLKFHSSQPCRIIVHVVAAESCVVFGVSEWRRRNDHIQLMGGDAHIIIFGKDREHSTP